MRRIVLLPALAVFAFSIGEAQTPTGAPGPLVFSGTGASETTLFTVKDRWQVRYFGAPVSITIEDANGEALMGGSGSVKTTLYMASGGNFKIRVVPNPAAGNLSATASWRLDISQAPAAGAQITVGTSDYVPPDVVAVAGNSPYGAPSTAFGTVNPTSATPGTVFPLAVPSMAPPAPPADPSAKMTDAQMAALVLIKGDNGEGTGFLVKTATGPVVVTNQHVIGANPHLHLTTTGGIEVKLAGLKIAGDRDLAMLPIQPGAYSYLELATPAEIATTVQTGDTVITPGNSEGGGVMLPCLGVVKAMGPTKVEVSNQFYHGNSGGPILHFKSGKVIGVVTEAEKVDVSNALDRASYASGTSGINAEMRYFGLRLDNVAAWNDAVWSKFENETEFLREFHERSKCLDSYLNTATNDVSEFGTYFARDEKLKEANTAYGVALNGADATQRMDATRDLIFSLDAVADQQADQVGNPSNFSSYNQQRAKDEAQYRNELKKEIGEMSSNVERIQGLARRTY